MSSTNFTSGLGDSNKTSSKVLRPPGGGNSQLFGDDVPNTPRSVKNHMASNIFGSDQNASVKQNGDSNRRGQKSTDSYTRLFGEPERNYTPAKNHMKSSIPIGGATGGATNGSSSVSSSSNGMETNGHKNGNGVHHHQNGNGTASSSASSRNGNKIENGAGAGGGSSSCASSDYQNGVSKTELESGNNSARIDKSQNTRSSTQQQTSLAAEQIQLDLNCQEEQTFDNNLPPEIDTSRSHLSSSRTTARSKMEDDENEAPSSAKETLRRAAGANDSYMQHNDGFQRHGDGDKQNSNEEQEHASNRNSARKNISDKVSNEKQTTSPISARSHEHGKLNTGGQAGEEERRNYDIISNLNLSEHNQPNSIEEQRNASSRNSARKTISDKMSNEKQTTSPISARSHEHGKINTAGLAGEDERRDYDIISNLNISEHNQPNSEEKQNLQLARNSARISASMGISNTPNFHSNMSSSSQPVAKNFEHGRLRTGGHPGEEERRSYDIISNLNLSEHNQPNAKENRALAARRQKANQVAESSCSKNQESGSKSPEQDLNSSRNPLTGFDPAENSKLTRNQRIRDGNPVTGEGYKGAEINTSIPSLNGANQVINKNRIPPGGYSSGLW